LIEYEPTGSSTKSVIKIKKSGDAEQLREPGFERLTHEADLTNGTTYTNGFGMQQMTCIDRKNHKAATEDWALRHHYTSTVAL
jgi:hypothetical protein